MYKALKKSPFMKKQLFISLLFSLPYFIPTVIYGGNTTSHNLVIPSAPQNGDMSVQPKTSLPGTVSADQLPENQKKFYQSLSFDQQNKFLKLSDVQRAELVNQHAAAKKKQSYSAR